MPRLFAAIAFATLSLMFFSASNTGGTEQLIYVYPLLAVPALFLARSAMRAWRKDTESKAPLVFTLVIALAVLLSVALTLFVLVSGFGIA